MESVGRRRRSGRGAMPTLLSIEETSGIASRRREPKERQQDSALRKHRGNTRRHRAAQVAKNPGFGVLGS